MKTDLSPTIRRILVDTRREIELDKSRTSPKRMRLMARDGIPVISFSQALSRGNALIAEIKERSPSQGKMLFKNFESAISAYKKSRVVKAISVLTSWHNFGRNMRVKLMAGVKENTQKPVLRKDFIIDEYQVYQARAYGADAILLMANILDAQELRILSDLAFSLGMDVLFETHCADELSELPATAEIIGINCRNFRGGLRPTNFRISRFLRQWLGTRNDQSVDRRRFGYASELPNGVIKVAESGVGPSNCREVFGLGFHSILVGTALLMDPRGIEEALREFECAITGQEIRHAPGAVRSLRPVPA